MAESDRLDLLIGELGRAMGMPVLALDASRYCSLAFDDKVVLTITRGDAPEGALLYAELGPIPEHARAEILTEMLAANAVAPPVPGGVLGLDRESGTALLLARPLLSSLSYPEFEALVEAMVNAAASWIDRLASAAHGVTAPVGDPAEPFAMIGALRG